MDLQRGESTLAEMLGPEWEPEDHEHKEEPQALPELDSALLEEIPEQAQEGEAEKTLKNVDVADQQQMRELVTQFYARLEENKELMKLLFERADAKLPETGNDTQDRLLESLLADGKVEDFVRSSAMKVQQGQMPVSHVENDVIFFLSQQITEHARESLLETRPSGSADKLLGATTPALRIELMREYVAQAISEVPRASEWFAAKARAEVRAGNSEMTPESLLAGLARRWATDPRENQLFNTTLNRLTNKESGLTSAEADQMILKEVIEKLRSTTSIEGAVDRVENQRRAG